VAPSTRSRLVRDVRVPAEDDRQQIAQAIAVSLNGSPERVQERAPRLPLGDMRCAYDGDRVVATAGEFRFNQWFGGRPVATSGIWGVTTLPEYRSSGLATACIRALLDGARLRGDALTSLFPAVLGPYRKLGYELAGTFTEHRIALEAIPATSRDELLKVDNLHPESDLEGVKACYRAWIREANGPVEPIDDTWWTKRVFDRPDPTLRCVVARDHEGSIEGFAAITRKETEGPLDVSFGLECEPLVATTPRALQTFLDYFRSHRGVGRWVSWNGPVNDPAGILVPEQSIETPFAYRWMLRPLRVDDALASRGYPPVDADVTIAIHDPAYPENDGAWRLRVVDGRPKVERTDTAPNNRPIPVGTFGAMFSGYLRPRDAVRLGLLGPDDTAVGPLSDLFSGPDPWCPFFF
jgi:predicted acetyltransferase